MFQLRDRDTKKVKAKELYRWGIDSSRYAALAEAKRDSAAIVIQSLIRRFLERSRWEVHRDSKRRVVATVVLQKHWRRLLARRLVEAMRRDAAVVVMQRKRRRKIGLLLRLLGFKHRLEQRGFLEVLEPWGLHPEQYTLGIRLIEELKEESNEFVAEFLHYKMVRHLD